MGHRQPQKLEERIAQELLLALSMVLIAIAQMTLMPTVLGATPALMLICVISRMLIEYTHITQSFVASLHWGIYGGLTLDVCTVAPWGSHALALIISIIAIYTLFRTIHSDTIVVPLVAIAVASLLYTTTFALFVTSTRIGFDWLSYAIYGMVPELAGTMLFTLPLFLVMRWLFYKRTLQQ